MVHRRMSLGSVLATCLVLAFVLGSLAFVLVGSSSVDITRPRLERDVAATFGNQYRQQQRLLGHPHARPARANATCAKGGPTVADRGPGRDWVCRVRYQLPGSAQRQESSYEVTARTEACYTATDPKLTAGHQFIRRASDRSDVDNPLYQFDGCFSVT